MAIARQQEAKAMSITGLEVFDSTMHQTNTWLKSLMGKIGTGDRHRAYVALRVTLHALRERLAAADYREVINFSFVELQLK
jgi:hypothetical protein